MQPSDFAYPELRRGDLVEWAPDPKANPQQWVLGQVQQPKNLSCDILVQLPTGAQWRYDCLHADDPRCVSQPAIHREALRGVFRLAPCERERREMMAKLGGLIRRMEFLEKQLSAPEPTHAPLPDPKTFRPIKRQAAC